ncbi:MULTISPECIES: SSI family serine proteinase inhibitor [unclassified Streptomyces]|uniref:SSI family serine proteinase inhibitor n=1 Tax=unclassified Streptomyces TaxID=2593676 RepID=UPI00093D3922|nr:SSI family serine proteinase inhibitor [Streptomyces sp. CB02400]OKK13695.1 serine protease [Streptomyces sp. CB02400]
MTHISWKTVRAGLLAALVLLACAAPARAGDGHAGEDNWLMLTVTPGETPSTGENGTMLRCDPPRGHRHATDACAELAAADGHIADIPPREGAVCPMIYAPVTAHADGMWRGRSIDYTETFPNTCTMTARTGSVFAIA